MTIKLTISIMLLHFLSKFFRFDFDFFKGGSIFICFLRNNNNKATPTRYEYRTIEGKNNNIT